MPRRPTTDPTLAVAYLRVSTDRQENGPEAQRTDIERWAEREGVTVVAWHLDRGVSGAAPIDKRPALLDALGSVELHSAGRLVVAKRDRLARDMVAGAVIERSAERLGAAVVSAAGEGEGDDPASLLMRRMVDAFAEYERGIIAQRTRAALAVKRRSGLVYNGTQAIGTRRTADGERLEADPLESRALAVIQTLRADGTSIRGIARELNARGIPARGEKWHPTTVARVLRRSEAV